MEIKDLLGLEKPITKLIEELSKGIGTLYKPRSIRNEAEAEAYRKETLAIAEAKKISIEGEAKIQLLERAKKRLVYQELTKQENIEEIAEKAIKYLNEEVSDKPLDSDWRTRFFQKAENISNEEMQEIWAKILANEVSKPNTISFRTLEVVSNLSKKEAELFQIACSLASSKEMIWKNKGQNAFKEYGLDYGKLMILKDAGLIHPNDHLTTTSQGIKQSKSIAPYLFTHVIGNDLYLMQNLKNPTSKVATFNQIAFTKAGKELCSLIESKLNEDYIKKIISEREALGYHLTKVQQK